MTGQLAPPLRLARSRANQTRRHKPRCPDALGVDRIAARVMVGHPEQGWSLLCNGVVLFDDGGLLLPGGRAVPPAGGRVVAAVA